jgi:hypothetical protein
MQRHQTSEARGSVHQNGGWCSWKILVGRRGEARRKRRTGDFHDVEIIHQVVPG